MMMIIIKKNKTHVPKLLIYLKTKPTPNTAQPSLCICGSTRGGSAAKIFDTCMCFKDVLQKIMRESIVKMKWTKTYKKKPSKLNQLRIGRIHHSALGDLRPVVALLRFLICVLSIFSEKFTYVEPIVKGSTQNKPKMIPLHNGFMTLLCNYQCGMGYFL